MQLKPACGRGHPAFPLPVCPFILLQLNDRLSLGQHRLWKRMTVKWTRVKPGQRALDVCCGSGDLALLLADAVGPAGRVTGLDFAADMLQVRLAGGPWFRRSVSLALCEALLWRMSSFVCLPVRGGWGLAV